MDIKTEECVQLTFTDASPYCHHYVVSLDKKDGKYVAFCHHCGQLWTYDNVIWI